MIPLRWSSILHLHVYFQYENFQPYFITVMFDILSSEYVPILFKKGMFLWKLYHILAMILTSCLKTRMTLDVKTQTVIIS